MPRKTDELLNAENAMAIALEDYMGADREGWDGGGRYEAFSVVEVDLKATLCILNSPEVANLLDLDYDIEQLEAEVELNFTSTDKKGYNYKELIRLLTENQTDIKSGYNKMNRIGCPEMGEDHGRGLDYLMKLAPELKQSIQDAKDECKKMFSKAKKFLKSLPECQINEGGYLIVDEVVDEPIEINGKVYKGHEAGEIYLNEWLFEWFDPRWIDGKPIDISVPESGYDRFGSPHELTWDGNAWIREKNTDK